MARTCTGLHHAAAVYAKRVTHGAYKSQCCITEIAACQRHLDDLKRQGDADFPYVFDTTRADRIIAFFAQCRQVRGVFQGAPIEMLDWQIFDQCCIYGWVHRDTGARRFNRTYQKRARGNVKSTEVSAKCLYHMTADAMYPPYHPELARFEMSPEVECAAVDRGQALRVYNDAKAIAEISPAIAKRLMVKRTMVYHRERGGFMRALSSDTKNKDSGAPSYFEVDEYHAHPTALIYNLGLSSFGKRPQALLDVITTAGDSAENKPCYREEEYARRVLLDKSVCDDTYFVMIRELDETDNPHNKACWVKANPILRDDTEYSRYLRHQIETEYTAAYGSGDPDKIRDFLTRRMCRWQSASANHYFDEILMTKFKKLAVDKKKFAELTDNLPCHTGYDLGKRIDLSGVGAVFEFPDGRFAFKVHGFLPENSAERHEATDRVPYKHWAKGGYCTLTPGDVTDNSYVNNWICEGEAAHKWEISEIDYDGHNATDLAILMQSERGEDSVVEISQTCAGLNGATKKFRELALSGKLIYEYSPLFEWCVANAIEVKNNFGDIKLSKKHKDDSQRIDPLAAVLNALARLLVKTENGVDINKRIGADDWHM